jgi:hypothetical protein
MKTKPILIILGVTIMLGGAFFFIKSRYFAKPEKNEIAQFLSSFNNQLKSGRTDSLLSYFETNQKTKVFKRLINILAGKTGINGRSGALFNLSLDIDNSDIKILSADFASAKVPEQFTHESIAPKITVLTFKIHKVSAHKFKITQVNANKFMSDYIAYENFVKSKTLTDKDIYSPITLQAFETAKQLKTRYDSVIWFAHVDRKNFFYVVKGKWDMSKDIYEKYVYSKYTNRFKDSVIEPYKMGLVNSDLKEIIPPDYDLVHNINGTFPGMVEVEKDNKKGFYDLEGKIVVPVNYDQIFPIDDESNLAVLKSGDDYYYLKKDMSISEKTELKIKDFFTKIVKLRDSFNLNANSSSIVTEYNSREENGALYISPSYLVDLNMVEKVQEFKNPLRKDLNEEAHLNYKVDVSDKIEETDNWFEATFYSIRDHFIGGRGEFYDKKNLVIIDKKKNRVFTQNIATNYSPDGGESLDGVCNINSIKAINDTLFEVKTGAVLWVDLYDSTKCIVGGPRFHYLSIKDNKLIELRGDRNFGFTKYVKMDDSYLNDCYNILVGSDQFDNRKKMNIDHLTPEILRYIKNEIYADYRYQFKDKRWNDIFVDMQSYDTQDPNKKNNVSVDDSLTDIDKYNINWINQKLKGNTDKKLAAR